jgi:hypothetical protein
MAEPDDKPNDPTPTDPPSNDPPPENEPTATADDIKAMKAALAKANKEAEASRKKLKDREDADLSEIDRMKKTNAEAEARATAAEMALTRHKVAVAKGLPPELAGRLQGTTEDEMAADADSLAALVKTRTTPGVPVGVRPLVTDADDMNARLRRATGRA